MRNQFWIDHASTAVNDLCAWSTRLGSSDQKDTVLAYTSLIGKTSTIPLSEHLPSGVLLVTTLRGKGVRRCAADVGVVWRVTYSDRINVVPRHIFEALSQPVLHLLWGRSILLFSVRRGIFSAGKFDVVRVWYDKGVIYDNVLAMRCLDLSITIDLKYWGTMNSLIYSFCLETSGDKCCCLVLFFILHFEDILGIARHSYNLDNTWAPGEPP